jgi:uncharacterized membrane protein HdeD (DUF308 family)
MGAAVLELDGLTRSWWAITLRGVAGIVFGIIAFIAPGISLVALVLLYAVYAFADGILGITAAFSGGRRWWLFLLEGILGIGAGVVTFMWPGITALVLLYLIAAWALATGIIEIVTAIRLRRVISGEWLLALAGILSIALGVVLFLFPGPGALAVVIWIGAFAFIFGVLLVTLGLRLRRLRSPAGPESTRARHGLNRPEATI